jgi:hypothetical protein
VKIGQQWSLGPLGIGGWVHCNGESTYRTVGLASWHNRRSITWRWLLWWDVPWKGKLPLRPRFYRQHHNDSGVAAVTLPLLGTLSYHWQRPMWREAKRAESGR